MAESAAAVRQEAAAEDYPPSLLGTARGRRSLQEQLRATADYATAARWHGGGAALSSPRGPLAGAEAAFQRLLAESLEPPASSEENHEEEEQEQAEAVAVAAVAAADERAKEETAAGEQQRAEGSEMGEVGEVGGGVGSQPSESSLLMAELFDERGHRRGGGGVAEDAHDSQSWAEDAHGIHARPWRQSSSSAAAAMRRTPRPAPHPRPPSSRPRFSVAARAPSPPRWSRQSGPAPKAASFTPAAIFGAAAAAAAAAAAGPPWRQAGARPATAPNPRAAIVNLAVAASARRATARRAAPASGWLRRGLLQADEEQAEVRRSDGGACLVTFCLIEAPWLVNGVHGAPLKRPG
jgi:hypothetical protein